MSVVSALGEERTAVTGDLLRLEQELADAWWNEEPLDRIEELERAIAALAPPTPDDDPPQFGLFSQLGVPETRTGGARGARWTIPDRPFPDATA